MCGRKRFPIQTGNKSVSNDIVRLQRLSTLSPRRSRVACRLFARRAARLGSFCIRTSANRVSRFGRCGTLINEGKMNSGALVVPSMPGQGSQRHQRANEMSGATPAAVAAYERAVLDFQNWRSGADVHVAAALEEAPDFVMAHALQAYMRICTRDPERVSSVLLVLARLSILPASNRERLHFLAIDAVVGDDYEPAKGHLGKILDLDPRDSLALHVAHAFDHLTGDVDCLNKRVAAVLPAWS